MSYLLDTHALIWFLEDDSKLQPNIRNLIIDSENKIFVSVISLYELAIKINIGKFTSKKTFSEIKQGLELNDIILMNVEPVHLDTFSSLPLISNHKDPFDRLLISTAISEKLTLISSDRKFGNYKELVKVIN